MKKINLYDYQQEMLENITKALTGRAQVTFYDQNGKKMKVGNSVVVMEEDMVMVKTASTERKRMTDQEFSILTVSANRYHYSA